MQVVGGPNPRTDYHDDPYEEFFYQLRGDIVLKVDRGRQAARHPDPRGRDPAAAGPLPPFAAAAQPGSVGLVVEKVRPRDVTTPSSGTARSAGRCVHRVEVNVQNIVADLPPLFEAFYAGSAPLPAVRAHPSRASG